MEHGVWVFSGGEWSKSVYEHGREAIAYAKLDVTGRWMIGARKFGTVTMVWQDYCEGGGVTQEYKAKRRATAMAKRILKGFK
mgnify:FL=1